MCHLAGFERNVDSLNHPLHDNGGDVDVSLDGLVGENTATVDVDLVANSDIVTENCYVLQAGPSANSAVPANDGGLDPSMVLDLGATEQHTSLQTNTISNNDIRSNCNIGTDSAVLANLG